MMGKALYLIVSGILAASAIAICVWVFWSPGDQTWNNEGLVDVPRLNFRPLPDSKKSILIRLQMSDNTNHVKWTKNLMTFLDKYYDIGKIGKGLENMDACSYRTFSPPKGRFCRVIVDSNEWGPCVRDNYFGYHKGTPCVFLKLNMIKGWVPEYYNGTNDLPELMPKDLKEHIRYEISTSERKTIWITCEGENPEDVEFLGPIRFYPTQGLPGYYFPYDKTEGYMSPVVALQFERPTIGAVINIECKAWAKNIKHNKEDGSGMVHFQLLVD